MRIGALGLDGLGPGGAKAGEPGPGGLEPDVLGLGLDGLEPYALGPAGGAGRVGLDGD